MTSEASPSHARLVFTPVRALAATVTCAAVITALLAAAHVILHKFSAETLATFGACAWLLVTTLLLVFLYGEESRLARELRTARVGSEIARTQAIRRRKRAPWFARFTAPPHGFAALLVTEGDSVAAHETLSSGSPLFYGGALATLRKAVEADAARDEGEAALGESIRTLLELPDLHAPEVDHYRTHVLVKAILQLGDPLTARDVEADLGASPDDEVRMYALWLRTWFDLTSSSPEVDEGERRRAALMARNSGAVDLATRLLGEAKEDRAEA